MAFIEISNLNAAGSDLFAGADSFLTELETTETTQIFGGRGRGNDGRNNNRRKSSRRRNSGRGNSGRRNSGRRNSGRRHGGWWC
jgi:hypothetical protein